MSADEVRTAFIEAATWHGSLERAETILKAHPELASSDIHTAAVLGDDAAVRRFIAQDPKCATATSPPYGGDALNYLCLSKYLRLDPSRSDAFLRAATALLDAGADPNTGFWTTGQFPERETALYGAAGVAHHAALTRLLVERGADPRDGEARLSLAGRGRSRPRCRSWWSPGSSPRTTSPSCWCASTTGTTTTERSICSSTVPIPTTTGAGAGTRSITPSRATTASR